MQSVEFRNSDKGSSEIVPTSHSRSGAAGVPGQAVT